MKKTAIIFDMDGTLWDTTPIMLKTWNEVFGSHEESRGTYADIGTIQSLMGKPMDEIALALLPKLSYEDRMRIFQQCMDEEDAVLKKSGGRLYPGLEETLAVLKEKYDLFIVSNGQAGYAELFIDVHGLSRYFDDWETFGRTGRPKSENIRLLMERNGIERGVYVGDTLLDESSAREAGVMFVHAAYGFGDAESPDASAGSFTELPEILEKLL